MKKFIEWLHEELRARGLKPADLARDSGLAPSTISRILSEQTRPSDEAYVKIARALREQPEKILRLAGRLPPEINPAPDEDQLLNSYRRLSSAEQQFLLKLLRAAMGQLPIPEITLTRQIITLPGPNSLSPDLEAIIEIVHRLDELERRLVFDYVRWRLMEQEERRNSSGRRHKSKQAKEAEWKRAIEHIDLLLAVDESDPEQQDWVINQLQTIIAARQAAHKKKRDLTVTTLSPGE